MSGRSSYKIILHLRPLLYCPTHISTVGVRSNRGNGFSPLQQDFGKLVYYFRREYYRVKVLREVDES